MNNGAVNQIGIIFLPLLFTSIAHGAPCKAPPFFDLTVSESPVSKFTSHALYCKKDGFTYLSTRRFEKDGTEYQLLLDPQTLLTTVEASACLQCQPADLTELKNTKLQWALNAVNQRKDTIENAGIIHAQGSAKGVFLTVDMCPSRHADYEKEIFEELRGTQSSVAIAMTGGWLRNHKDLFRQLRDRNNFGDLHITWVNHTMNHPYTNHVPNRSNFLLEPGVNIEEEVFGMEQLFLSYGVAPSPFFRFPGLISDRRLIDYLTRHFIIPVGSDAWLAKGQRPVNGSIVLVHGNENEHIGVTLWQQWMDKFGLDTSLLSLPQLF